MILLNDLIYNIKVNFKLNEEEETKREKRKKKLLQREKITKSE